MDWSDVPPEERARLTARVILVGSFVDELERRGERWELVTDPREQRLAAGIRAVDGILGL